VTVIQSFLPYISNSRDGQQELLPGLTLIFWVLNFLIYLGQKRAYSCNLDEGGELPELGVVSTYLPSFVIENRTVLLQNHIIEIIRR
jgi:hypothetical protein